VLHYRYGPVGGVRPTQAELQDLTAAVLVYVLTPMMAAVTNKTRWTGIMARDIHDEFGAIYSRTLNPVLYGLRSGDPLPGNVQAVIAKKTTSPLRRGKGRMFLMDLSEVDVSDALINTNLQALMVNIGVGILRNLGILRNFVAVVASKKFGSFAPIISIAFDLITDSLRTRLKNHRRRHHTP